MMNMKDLLGGTKGDANAEGESGGLSGLMDIAKDFDMADIEKYKNMSKSELLEEVKNSEHSEKVITYLKGLLDSKK